MGDKDKYEVLVKIMCSNQTVTNMSCVEFAMKMQAKVHMEFKNLVFYFNVSNVVVQDTVIRRDHIGLNDSSFQADFQRLLNNQALQFNKQYEGGISVGDLKPEAKMIGGILKNTTFTPYVRDNWFYGGLSLYADSEN